MRRLLLPLLLLTFSISTLPAGKHPYLFVWAGDDDKKTSDFFAVIDADPASATYGDVVATKPTGMAGAVPHHTEDPVAANHHLLANGFEAGRTWLFDLHRPLAPRILTSFGDLDGFNHPHTYIRLPNGHVLATFQYHGEHQTGGLVEFDEHGNFIRSGSAVGFRSKNSVLCKTVRSSFASGSFEKGRS